MKPETCLTIYFYVPEGYLTHFSYCCLFLYCSVQRAVWVGVGGAGRSGFTSSRQGGGRGGEQDVHRPSPLCILPLCSWPFQGPKRSRFSGLTPSNGPRYGCSPHQNHFVPPHINNRISLIGSQSQERLSIYSRSGVYEKRIGSQGGTIFLFNEFANQIHLCTEFANFTFFQQIL